MIELLITLVCVGIISVVVVRLINTTQMIQRFTSTRAGASYAAREALDILSREIRHAGFRTIDLTAGEPEPIPKEMLRIGTLSSSQSIRLRADIDENGVVGDARGEDVTYYYANNTLYRRDKNIEEVLLGRPRFIVGDFSFTYFNEDREIMNINENTQPEDLDKIYSIRTDFTLYSPLPNGEGTISTKWSSSISLRNTAFNSKGVLQW